MTAPRCKELNQNYSIRIQNLQELITHRKEPETETEPNSYL